MRKRHYKLFIHALIIAIVMPLLSPIITYSNEESEHDVELWNVVNPLATTVSFLNTGAHPDDERSDLQSYLSRGLGVQTTSLIANRGEGGQNQIGSELGNALGIIRSEEMKKAAEITGVKAYHLSEELSDPIYDFGFSKTAEETLEIWGEEFTYEKFIRFIREYKPDIIMSSFRDVPSEHGHHRALTQLTLSAFEDAANPEVFPQHLDAGLEIWQSKKMYLPAESEDTATLSIEVGDYDLIYEMSYPQLGEQSRYLHKSQGMGKDIEVEPKLFHLELIDSTVSKEDDESLFDGLLYNFSDWAESLDQESLSEHLTKLHDHLVSIVNAYPSREIIFEKLPEAMEQLELTINLVEEADLEFPVKDELLHKLQNKKDQLNLAHLVASNIKLDLDLKDEYINPDEDITFLVEITNENEASLDEISLKLLSEQPLEIQQPETIKSLDSGENSELIFDVHIPEHTEIYHPYRDDAFEWQLSIINQGVEFIAPITFDSTLAILPKISLKSDPNEFIINTTDAQESYTINVLVDNFSNNVQEVDVYLDLPNGWTYEPENQKIEVEESSEVTFNIYPPNELENGEFIIGLRGETKESVYNSSVQEIQYDHIGQQFYVFPAEITGKSFALDYDPTLKIGYIDSGFDNISEKLKNLGMNIHSISDDELASGALNEYDTIVVGIRANLSRENLVDNIPKLHDFVHQGGHLVYQYHNPWDNWDTESTLPYMVEIGQPSIEWRVTNEEAKVEILQPEHPIFNYPNIIDDEDWDHWVQERGLYFPMNWSEEYETFVRMADPNEDPFDGGILLADYGEGTVLYTNLVFYRQIDNQVPGGYRIFTNLLHLSNQKD